MKFARDPKTGLLVPQRNIIPELDRVHLQWFAAANGFVTESPDVRYGDATEAVTGGYLLGQKFTAPGSGTLTITEIGLWAKVEIGENIRLKMFEHDAANNCPEGDVTNSYTDAIAGRSADVEKYYFTYSTQPTITGGAVYWIVGFADATTAYDKFDDALDVALFRSATYPTFPSGDTWHSHNDQADDFGFYAVYTGGGEGSIVVLLNNLRRRRMA